MESFNVESCIEVRRKGCEVENVMDSELATANIYISDLEYYDGIAVTTMLHVGIFVYRFTCIHVYFEFCTG